MAGNQLTLFLDLDTLGFGVGVSVPYSLQDLLAELPGQAADALGWMPDITLDEVRLAFDSSNSRFALLATAGIAGSADPSAAVFLEVQPIGVPPRKTHAFVVGLTLDTPIDLGGTPLLGPMLDGITVDDFALTYASEDIPDGGSPVTPRYVKGFALNLTLRAGDTEVTFHLTPRTRPRTLRLSRTVPAEAEPPVVQWFAVQRKLGPLSIDRIGIATPPGRFGLALDAGLNIAALRVALTGFTATFPQDDISLPALRVDLDGLAVSFTSGPVKLAGSLVRTTNHGVTEYSGGMVIQAGKFGIAAVGAFATVEGAISLFVFGMVLGPFGGPPAFFVTGLAAGFGYNRSLKLPPAGQVQDYPLVLAAKNGSSYLPDASPAAALSKLSQGGWVPPRAGSYWIAAGVRFTSFQLLDSFAVVALEFGRDLVIALLGVSALKLPKVGPTYAYAELALSAVLRPDDGTFQITAMLTPSSFVLDRNCRLTGGFAFWLWFGPHERAGDFVVTLGGYNPHYTPPSWYPQVPRLGFAWQVSSKLSMSGGAYFALTPSCVMAGGSLSAAFRDGDLRVSFTAWADFLLWWDPFWFDIRVGVSISASYTLTFLGVRKRFSTSLDATVELWGPPLAGKARVNWWVISFTIDINGGRRPATPRVLPDWTAFAQAYLPADRTGVCRPVVPTGLLEILERDIPGGKEAIWVVSSAGVSLGFETLIPTNTWVIGGGEDPFHGPAAGVYPLGSVVLRSTTTLSLVPLGQDQPIRLASWNWTPQASRVPEAVWGLINQGRPNVRAQLQPAMLGGVGASLPPRLVGPPPVSLEVLSLGYLVPRDLPLPLTPPIDGSTPPPPIDPREVVRATVMAPQVVAARDQRVAVLDRIGVGAGLRGGDLRLLAEEVAIAFPAAPMLGPLGSTGPRPAPDDAPVEDARREPVRRAPARSHRASSRQAAPHALRALFHHHAAPLVDWRQAAPGHARAYLLDGGATARERGHVLAGIGGVGGRAQARLGAGTSLLWEVAPASRLTLESNGRLPLRVIVLDAGGVLVEQRQLDGAGELPLPDLAWRVLVSALDGAGTAVPAAAAGWRGASPLLLAAPQALVGDGAIIRPQSPQRARRAGSADVGVSSGAALARDNAVAGGAGWIETQFPGGARAVVVALRHDGATCVRNRELAAVEDTPLTVFDRSSRPGSLAPRAIRVEGERAFLFYESPAAGPLGAVAQPPAGWLADGVLGFPIPIDEVLGRPRRPAAPPARTAAATVEVTVR